MFGHRYFAASYFAPRYFPDGGDVVPDDGIELLGGGLRGSPYRHYKKRDIVQEVVDEIESISRKKETLADTEKALELARQDGIKAKKLARLERDVSLLREQVSRQQIELQALVAMKERMDMLEQEDLLILAMSLPFSQLKL